MKVDRKDVNVYDLRSAIEILKDDKNELVYTNTEVDPHGEIAGIYRHVGAGGTVKRPTKIGPAMIFNNVKNHNELVYTNTEVDPHGEIAGIYRHVGAGGTVKRPTKIGPAMIFNNVKNHGDSKVLIGLFSSRERVSKLLGCKPDQLGFLLNEAVKDAIAPITIENKDAKCQEVVHYLDVSLTN